MSKCVMVANYYAKAAFDLSMKNQSIDHWQNMLIFLNMVIKNEKIAELIGSIIAPKTIAEILISICAERLDQNGKNLVNVMAEYNHLYALPKVLEQFIKLRKSNERITEVEIISSTNLSTSILLKLANVMEKYLLCKVRLHCKINKHIIAGIIICFNDIVIDGSIRNRLKRLADTLRS